MPKLRRRLRMNQPQVTNLIAHSTESSGISQASSSHSVRDDQKHLGLGKFTWETKFPFSRLYVSLV